MTCVVRAIVSVRSQKRGDVASKRTKLGLHVSVVLELRPWCVGRHARRQTNAAICSLFVSIERAGLSNGAWVSLNVIGTDFDLPTR